MSDLSLEIKTHTWAKESHGLFDYQTKDIIKNFLSIKTAGKLMRRGSECLFKTDDDPSRDECLFKVVEMNEEFWVTPYKSDRLWVVVSEFQRHGMVIHKGDVIRFGRIRLKVRDLSLYGNMPVEESKDCCDVETAEKDYACRICLGESDLIDNRLITPCKCDGTMKYIHYRCLKEWLRSKILTHTNQNIIIYN